MQLATNPTAAPVNWSKVLQDAARDEPPIERRAAVRLSEEAVYAFVDFESDEFYLKPERLGYDLYRQHGGPDGMGRDMLDTMMALDGKRLTDTLWESFKRPRSDSDLLLIDVMNEAIGYGFEPPAEVLLEIEALRDVHAAREAERKAHGKVQEDRFYKFVDLDEAGYGDWLDAGKPDGRARKIGRWRDRDAAEDAELARIEARRAVTSLMPGTPMPSNVVALHPAAPAAAVRHEDFWAYSPSHSYIFVPTGEHWPASTVNARLAPVAVPMREKPIAAATYLDQNRSVEQATWAPGQPQIIENRLIADGGWIDRTGCKTFNLYRPPTIRPMAGDAAPWVNHVRWIYPDEADHIIQWLAQRVQRPEQKINHALVLGGNQGIGKDTLLEPVKAAVGPWNCSEVSPQQVLGRFNSFVKSVILRISEARDLGETDRFAYYEHLKTLTAAPPDVLRVDEKHLREHAVLNVCGVIQTTNNKDALHLPMDDRRHFVAWSPRTKDDFQPGYWSALYKWFANGGNEVVAHHLMTLDLADFDAKAPPPKTRAFWEIVDASRAPEDAEMADAIDALGKPPAVTVQLVLTRASVGFSEWLRDRRNRRRIGHRFEGCDYVAVRNPDDARDGQWKIAGRRQTVYARRDLAIRDQIAAAQRLK